MGAQLLLTQSIDPRLLERHDEFRFTVLSRFEDAVSGKLTDNVDANVARRLLRLISALAPIRPDDRQFQEGAADFLGIRKRPSLTLLAYSRSKARYYGAATP